MTMYIIAGLAGVAAWFYALYQRSERQRAEVALSAAQKQLVQSQADTAAERGRYEALVTDLKAQVKRMSDAFAASATPDAVRAQFDQLFPHSGAAGAVGPGVPAGGPARDAAGGAHAVPAGK
jgi:uncharacterized protein YlxW (UPF0749 family)